MLSARVDCDKLEIATCALHTQDSHIRREQQRNVLDLLGLKPAIRRTLTCLSFYPNRGSVFLRRPHVDILHLVLVLCVYRYLAVGQ